MKLLKKLWAWFMSLFKRTKAHQPRERKYKDIEPVIRKAPSAVRRGMVNMRYTRVPTIQRKSRTTLAREIKILINAANRKKPTTNTI